MVNAFDLGSKIAGSSPAALMARLGSIMVVQGSAKSLVKVQILSQSKTGGRVVYCDCFENNYT